MARDIAWPANVDVAPARSRSELAALYAAASVVVVPVVPNRHASGATSVIEGMACGRPMVVSRAGGLDDYVGDDAMLVEPGDASDLAAGIDAALRGEVRPPPDGALRRRGLTQADYVDRYALLTTWLLGTGEFPDAVSEFGPVTRSSSRRDPPRHP